MKKSNLFSAHGRLHVEGTQLMDKKNRPFQLVGMSSYGMLRKEYLTTETFETLRDEWHMNCIRLALYVTPSSGYVGWRRSQYRKTLFAAVEAATALDMYVIIDWHVLQDGNPLVHSEQAVKFFKEMSKRFQHQGNIIYEICNEPNGPEGTWENITTYANMVIPVIRENDPDSVVMVGTPVWSQKVMAAAQAPLPYDNLLYSLHFYAATHGKGVRGPAEEAVKAGLGIAVNEFNICTCSGGGELNMEEAAAWKDFIETNGISFIMWNLSNVDESSSILKATTQSVSHWTEEELNESGRWMKAWCVEKWKKA